MKTLSRDQLIHVLKEIRLRQGDNVLVHSALHYLGKPEGGVEMILDVLLNILGISEQEGSDFDAQGTLVVPAFNFSFARGEPFDLHTTPSVGMGVLSEYVRQHPWARRSPHPMQSVVAIGRHAADLASRHTAGAFDAGSAFDRMVALNFKIVLLGADVQAISLLHYVEQRVGVPYRYWKNFHGRVRLGTEWEERTYRMYVRDLDLNPCLDLRPIQSLLEARGQWISRPLSYGFVSACQMRDFVIATEELLRRDPWVLVTNRPQLENDKGVG